VSNLLGLSCSSFEAVSITFGVGNLPQQVVFSLGQRACLMGDNQPQQIDSTGRKTAVASVPDSLGNFPYVAYQIGNPLSRCSNSRVSVQRTENHGTE
jgi:hypothetical protein